MNQHRKPQIERRRGAEFRGRRSYFNPQISDAFDAPSDGISMGKRARQSSRKQRLDQSKWVWVDAADSPRRRREGALPISPQSVRHETTTYTVGDTVMLKDDSHEQGERIGLIRGFLSSGENKGPQKLVRVILFDAQHIIRDADAYDVLDFQCER
jgi:hypothetical protein